PAEPERSPGASVPPSTLAATPRPPRLAAAAPVVSEPAGPAQTLPVAASPQPTTAPPPDKAAVPSSAPPETVPAVTPAAAAAAPQPSAGPAEADLAILDVRIKPWAELTVDGRTLGTTSEQRLVLPAGTHALVFTHPEFEPLRRRITLQSAERRIVSIDLKD